MGSMGVLAEHFIKNNYKRKKLNYNDLRKTSVTKNNQPMKLQYKSPNKAKLGKKTNGVSPFLVPIIIKLLC